MSQEGRYRPVEAWLRHYAYFCPDQWPEIKKVIEEGDMFNVPETPDAKCFERATRRGQKTFTLVQQDRSGASVICEWIRMNINTAPAAKLREALEAAIEFRDFPNRKNAD